jgi:hypothetical protein
LGTRSRDNAFSCTGLSPSTATPSRGLPLTTLFSHSPHPRQKVLNGPTTPTTQRLPAITCDRFSLLRFRSPLLTESRLFSLPVGTEMFHFPTFPPHALCVQARVTPHDWCGVPPFGNPRINARLTAPRGLSQPPTSFIGSWCQGIHRAPLTTWPHKNTAQPAPGRTLAVRAYKNPANQSLKDARVHCAVLNVRPDTGHPTPPDPDHPQATRRSEMQTGPARQRLPAPSGPNSVPTNRTIAVHRVPCPLARAVLAATRKAGRTGQRSTLEHCLRTLRGHPVVGDRHGPSTALDHHNQCGGQCSLERR